MSDDEIHNKIINIRKALFELRFQKATRKRVKPHLFKQYRKTLAQLLTIKVTSCTSL